MYIHSVPSPFPSFGQVSPPSPLSPGAGGSHTHNGHAHSGIPGRSHSHTGPGIGVCGGGVSGCVWYCPALHQPLATLTLCGRHGTPHHLHVVPEMSDSISYQGRQVHLQGNQQLSNTHSSLWCVCVCVCQGLLAVLVDGERGGRHWELTQDLTEATLDVLARYTHSNLSSLPTRSAGASWAAYSPLPIGHLLLISSSLEDQARLGPLATIWLP